MAIRTRCRRRRRGFGALLLRLFPVLAIHSLLSGCLGERMVAERASPADYHETFSGGLRSVLTGKPVGVGYSQEKLSANSYKVLAGGNDWTSVEHVENMALFRAAELGRQDGFARLVVHSVRRRQACKTRNFAVTLAHPIVEMTVVYSNDAAGQTGHAVQEVMDRLGPLVRSPENSTDAKMATSRANRATCSGRS